MAAVAAVGGWIAAPLPPGLLTVGTEPALVLLDRHGRELRRARADDGSRRRWTALADMDPDLVAAFVAVEDQRFHRHVGIDPRAIGRAALANLRAGQVVSGGSTITMQLARMLRPMRRTWPGKAVQAMWALRLEAHLDKQTILEQYLNRVPLGQGAVGVDAAAALYFAGTSSELSLGQAALLAGLARAPSTDNPLVAPARAARRRDQALSRLRSLGYAGADATDRAADERVVVPGGRASFRAAHFTTRVLQWSERAGIPASGTLGTSLDLALQEEIEAEVRHTVRSLHDRGARHAAAVVLDNRSGDLLVWVGSPDFWADTAGQVDMVVSARQPGSALKPFLYALAFDQGYTPASVLPDIARVYQTTTGPYAPRNYDRRFHGPVRAREALGSSYNVPAVELADRLGVARMLRVLHGAGFTSLGRSADFYGLGLALGNGDVTLLELANGYRALANEGMWRPYSWRSAPGAALDPGHRVVEARSAALVLDILSDPVARTPAFGPSSPLDFPFQVAAKTGTSRHFTDNWAVAVTGGFTVAVWVGNFSGRPMDGVSGVSGAGPLLHRAVLATARRYAAGALPSPPRTGAVPLTICRLSGLQAGARCPTTTEWFPPELRPERECDWHREAGISLPVEYAEWSVRDRGETPARTVARVPPPAHTGGAAFRIVSPLDGDVYRVPPGAERRYATIPLRAAGADAAGAVRWFVDGAPVATPRWVLTGGLHRIRALAPSGEQAEVTVRVQ
jgi:penicillin-binding protein 1C